MEIILYKPIFNALIFIYEHFSFGDLGIAIVVVTLLVRFITLPISRKNSRDQIIMQRLGPKVKAIQAEHKHDKERQTKEIMRIYEEHRVNPASVMGLLFLQAFIGFGLYRVFSDGVLKNMDKWIYSFIPKPETLNFAFLGVIDLRSVSWILIVAALLAQAAVSWLSLIKQSKIQKKGALILSFSAPLVLTAAVLRILPAAIALYWLTTTLFSVIQQVIINKSLEEDGGTEKLS